MKWFKHMADTLDDSWVQDQLMKDYGLEGYGFWCGLLEVYAKHWDGDATNIEVEIPLDTLSRKFRLKRPKIERLLRYCSTSTQLLLNLTDVTVQLQIPKMQEYRDEWSRKLRSDSGIRNKNKEIKKKKPPISPKGDLRNLKKEFEEVIWPLYPNKQAKPKALEAYIKARSKVSLQVIKLGLNRYLKGKPEWQAWKMPATWLNQECWQDVWDTPVSGQTQTNLQKPRWQVLKEAKMLIYTPTGQVIPTDKLEVSMDGGGAVSGFTLQGTDQWLALGDFKLQEEVN